MWRLYRTLLLWINNSNYNLIFCSFCIETFFLSNSKWSNTNRSLIPIFENENTWIFLLTNWKSINIYSWNLIIFWICCSCESLWFFMTNDVCWNSRSKCVHRFHLTFGFLTRFLFLSMSNMTTCRVRCTRCARVNNDFSFRCWSVWFSMLSRLSIERCDRSLSWEFFDW